jgi:endonuclease/exonuclease/phosphatase family metal-dependent hydrolase
MTRTLHLMIWWLAAAAPAAALTIATYNVENYLLADRLADGVYREAYPKPESERTALRQVVAGLAPDILAVQEMGGAPYLEEFQRELSQAGQDYPFAALLEGPDPDRHVAVLAKVPFQAVRRHDQLPTAYLGRQDRVKRGVLEVVIASPAGDFSLFVVHLKSRHTERADDPESAQQRQAEAVAVRDLVLARYPDPAKGRYIICGDWNDSPGSRAVRALARRGDTSLGEILAAADSRGDTWTHYYRREDAYSRMDYVLVSPALRALVAGGRAVIADGPGVRDASDHRPVGVELALAVTRPKETGPVAAGR